MKKVSCIIAFFLLSIMNIHSQSFKMDLYPEGEIPNYKDVGEQEVWDTTNAVRISKVQVPDIAVFLPAKQHRTGEAVIICPGGGYRILAYDKEGEDIAKFFNSRGIAGIVLKYRVPVSDAQIEPHKSPLMDAQRAMRLVRYHAEAWGLDPEKIGIMGFSAGGHLAASLSTHHDQGNKTSDDPVERLSCRPDFSILLYPVISFTGEFQHSGSRRNLAGDDEELMKYYSNELQVAEDTPPAILIHSSDDSSVPFKNSVVYYEALLENGVENSEMHIYPYGGHGYSLAIGTGRLSTWPDRVADWLEDLY
ncbi:MAG TPA: alpha/beta hydrolase [Bacteroidales bacterium]|nr:alpha/beta hydrolase [Bacteroidales bacterium]